MKTLQNTLSLNREKNARPDLQLKARVDPATAESPGRYSGGSQSRFRPPCVIHANAKAAEVRRLRRCASSTVESSHRWGTAFDDAGIRMRARASRIKGYIIDCCLQCRYSGACLLRELDEAIF